MKISGGDFLAHRDVPPEWETALASVSPKSDRLPWLKLAWMAGIFYEPISRWVLYEMVPDLAIVDPFRLEALRGPAPRSLGEWVKDEEPPYINRWVSHSLVSQLQWELFRETNCAPFLFWIIQGPNGGHRWRLPAEEKQFVCSLYGEGADVPNPGERPYAEFSQRMIDQIVRHDQLRQWDRERSQPFGTLRKNDAGLFVAARVFDKKREYGALMLKYLTDQIEDGISNLSDKDVQRIMDRRVAPQYGNVKDTSAEEVERRLIEQV